MTLRAQNLWQRMNIHDGTIAFLPDVRIYRQRGKGTKRNEKGSRAITPQVVERDDFRTTYPEQRANTWWLTNGAPSGRGAFDRRRISRRSPKREARLFYTESVVIINHRTLLLFLMLKIKDLDFYFPGTGDNRNALTQEFMHVSAHLYWVFLNKCGKF